MGGQGMPVDMELPEEMRGVFVRASFAAEIKGVHVETIKRHIYKNRLRAEKVGREWLIYRDSLKSWEPDPGGPSKV